MTCSEMRLAIEQAFMQEVQRRYATCAVNSINVGVDAAGTQFRTGLSGLLKFHAVAEGVVLELFED